MLRRQMRLNGCKMFFMDRILLRSVKKAFHLVWTIKYFLSKLRKQVLLSIINYDFMCHPKDMKFVEVGKLGIGFRLS